MNASIRVFYSVYEAAARWGCSAADVIGLAALDRIQLMTGIPGVQTLHGPISGLVHLHGADILAMARRDGSGSGEIRVKRIRAVEEGADWRMISDPPEGIPLAIHDVLILATDVHEFEGEHNHGPPVRAGFGSKPETYKYDWDAMYVAVIKRIHEHGLPDNQTEFVGEFQEWFSRRDPKGEAPDERTIRRRLNPIWRALREDA